MGFDRGGGRGGRGGGRGGGEESQHVACAVPRHCAPG
jgi:hypothetical protein